MYSISLFGASVRQLVALRVSTSCLSGRVGQTEEPGAAAGLVTTDQHAGELFLPD